MKIHYVQSLPLGFSDGVERAALGIAGPNNGTKVVSKEAIRMQQTGALLWLYAWRNEAGNPTLQLYHQKSEEHEH